MIESQSIRELHLDPPTPTEIVQMPLIERNELLALPPEILNFAFKGFLTGERLEKYYSQKKWMPDGDLLNAMLFAGKGNFDGLQRYTYEQIENLSVILKDNNNNFIKYPVPTDNIWCSLHIVERLVADQLRRTGEPVVAHNYRCLLYLQQRIDYYNNLHNLYYSNTRHTPEIAEVEYIATNLHDFEEDPIMQTDESIEVGQTKIIPNPDDEKNNMLFFLRRAHQSKRGRTTVLEDIKLDLGPKQIHYLNNALRALNSSQTDKDLIIDHLLGIVHEGYASIKLFDAESFVLNSIPIYVKTGADRPDNLATYFVRKHPASQQLIPVTPNKITNKAQENISMFNLAEIHMLLDSPELFGSPPIYNTTDDVSSPSSLRFFPSRWGKLSLLGLSPNQMYTISEQNGLPELI